MQNNLFCIEQLSTYTFAELILIVNDSNLRNILNQINILESINVIIIICNTFRFLIVLIILTIRIATYIGQKKDYYAIKSKI